MKNKGRDATKQLINLFRYLDTDERNLIADTVEELAIRIDKLEEAVKAK